MERLGPKPRMKKNPTVSRRLEVKKEPLNTLFLRKKEIFRG